MYVYVHLSSDRSVLLPVLSTYRAFNTPWNHAVFAHARRDTSQERACSVHTHALMSHAAAVTDHKPLSGCALFISKFQSDDQEEKRNETSYRYHANRGSAA
jgi:hypothetical protein